MKDEDIGQLLGLVEGISTALEAQSVTLRAIAHSYDAEARQLTGQVEAIPLQLEAIRKALQAPPWPTGWDPGMMVRVAKELEWKVRVMEKQHTDEMEDLRRRVGELERR